MKATVRRSGDIPIVDLAGRIVLGEGDAEMRQAIEDLLTEGHRGVLVDLRKVTFMDSTGLGQLASAHIRAAKNGAALKLIKPNTKVLDLFTITRLNLLFEIFEDEKQAIASF